MRSNLLPVCLLAVFMAPSRSQCDELAPARKLVLAGRPLIIAHRGNSSVAPENTLPAFQAALDAKADLVELDYYHSADGVPVVFHDKTLDRTTNAKALLGQEKLTVSALPLAELQKLDAGTWFDTKFAAARLPTLSESLDLIQSGSVTLIERKAGDPATLVRLLEEKKLVDNVVVQAFDWQFIAECRKLSPTLALGTLHGKPATEGLIRAAAATGADIIGWNHEEISRGDVELIHRLGKRSWVYTVDDPQRAAELVAAGVDGIITNRPGAMLPVREAGQR